MAAELSPILRARYDAIRWKLDISDEIYGNKTWQPDYQIIHWIENNPGFPVMNKKNHLFKWPLRSRKDELANLLPKTETYTSSHEENPLYKLIPSYFSEEDKCRVKYIVEHLDIPFEETVGLKIKEHVYSVISWVTEKKGFPKTSKEGLFVRPIENEVGPTDPRFLLPKRSCAQRLVPLTGTFKGSVTKMIWVPYYATQEEVSNIREIYRKRELDATDPSSIARTNSSLNSGTALKTDETVYLLTYYNWILKFYFF
jgi:hypothetical protein